jgi:ADP-heptose:LPS heptosyltransferase
LKFLVDYQVDRPNKIAVLAETEIVLPWTENINGDKPILYVKEEEIRSVLSFLEFNGVSRSAKILLFNPGGNVRHSVKDWEYSYYAPVADYFISNHGFKVIINGFNQDEEDLDKISSLMKEVPVIITGITLRQFFALISVSKLVFGIDTGTIHASTALNVPVFCLMGFNDPDDTGPYNPEAPARTLTSDLSCVPCLNKNPKPEQWNICKNLYPVECMRRITPEQVILEIEDLLGI